LYHFIISILLFHFIIPMLLFHFFTAFYYFVYYFHLFITSVRHLSLTRIFKIGLHVLLLIKNNKKYT